MRFASIDIGSNAVRLLLCNVIEESKDTHFKKNELIRMPIRLGDDAFLNGRVSEEKGRKLINTMKAFKYLIEVFDSVSYRACATSAMRDAENGNEIIEQIKKEAAVKVEIIDGKTEAEIIYSNHIAEYLEHNHSYLYIDVGGGSTQLTLFAGNKIVFSQSFNVGTIRFLHNTVSKEYWTYFKETVKEITRDAHPLTAIGSGGNINKLFKMLGKKDNKPVYYDKLKELHEYISGFTIEERTTQLGLNPDRADVIVPAAKIFLTVMKNGGIQEMIVPQIGLSDGIVHLLYEEYKAKNEEGVSA